MIDLTSISRFAARVLAVRPALGKELHEPAAFIRAEMAAALEGARADDEAAFKRRLRRLRERVLLRVMARAFVSGQYLDYATLDAMRGLHAEVRRDVERRELAGHVKLGPGGIREVEFIVQALQLIRGGRDASLAVRPTLAVLAVLAERQQLPQAAALELAQAYVFLRRVEH